MDGSRRHRSPSRCRTLPRRAGVPLALLLSCTLPLVGVGCGSNKLETGYQYSPLGESATKRRAYYAGPFSPEAREALLAPGNDTAVGPDARRPRPGS